MGTIFVTGGAGFIGSTFTQRLIKRMIQVVNLDLLTYASNKPVLASLLKQDNHIFVKGSVCDSKLVEKLLLQYAPNTIVHFAAESHVDRSIENASNFINTNILGTYQMLVSATHFWNSLKPNLKKDFRFIHISTDEVFGSLSSEGKFSETSPYNPRSPYSASKAAADHLVRSWNHTYGLPIIITNCSNNYGPYQFPEKLIPMLILAGLENKPLPIYGDGKNVRDWLHVEDHCTAIELVMREGIPGHTYCIGGNAERTNMEVAHTICEFLDLLAPRIDDCLHSQSIKLIADRPGHDFRYAIDTRKINELGWQPKYSFETGLYETVQWYLKNQDWWSSIRLNEYSGERLGMLEAI